MKAWNVTQEQLERSAERAGVRLSNARPEGNAIAFVLRTHGPTTSGLPVRWGRVARNRTRKDGTPVRVSGAVCWHGHREFMRDLFDTAPECRLKSALADYRGRDDFNAKYPGTYDPDAHPCDCTAVRNGDPDTEALEAAELAGRRLRDGAEWARDVIRRSHDLRELFGGLRWSTTLSQAGQIPQQTVEDAFKVDGTVPQWFGSDLLPTLAHGLYAERDLRIGWLVYPLDSYEVARSGKYDVRKGQKTLRPVMRYARDHNPDMLPALEQAAQTLGQLHAKREENPDPWTVTLSVAPTDWLRLGMHYDVDDRSCYRNGHENEEAKYVLGLHPFSFVALVRDGDGDVSARAWGFLDPDGGAYVNNVYPGDRLNEYHVHNMIRQALSEVTGTELEQASYDAYVPDDGAWSIVYKNACERTYGDPEAVEKLIDHPGLARYCDPHFSLREECPHCGDIDETLVECFQCDERVCGYCTVEVDRELYCLQHNHERCPDCREVFFPNGGSAECAGERCRAVRCGPCVENVEQTACTDCETPTCVMCAYTGRGGLRCRTCFIAEDERERQKRLQRRAQQAPAPAEPGGERRIRIGDAAPDGGECECVDCERWRINNGQPLLRPDLAEGEVPGLRPGREQTERWWNAAPVPDTIAQSIEGVE